jgi:hypothetical protein
LPKLDQLTQQADTKKPAAIYAAGLLKEKLKIIL